MECKKCKKEIDHPRRGMCLNCYRKVTGLSKTKTKSIPIKSTIKPIITIRRTPLIENKEDKEDKDKEDKESLSTKWWNKYLESDFLERQDIIASLPLIKELAQRGFPDLSKIDKYKKLSKKALAIEQEKFNSHMLSLMMLSYIEDLIDYMDK